MICHNMRQYLLYLFNGNLFKYRHTSMYVETGLGARTWYGYFIHTNARYRCGPSVDACYKPFPKGSNITYVTINTDVLWGQIP